MTDSMPRSTPLPPFLRGALTVAVLSLVTVGGLYIGLFRLEVQPRVAFAPGWALVDDAGDPSTSEDYRGSIVLYSFSPVEARDPRRDVLPVLREVQEGLGREGEADVPVRIVTVLFDGESADREALLRVRERVDADPEVWSFVTGDARRLDHLVRRGFETWFEKRSDGSWSYDPVVVLVDGWGIERARYRFGLPDPERLLRDVRSVRREASTAEGPARLAYEAAHLFSCYSTV